MQNSGESSHLLLGIDSHMWVEFVVSYLACSLESFFSRLSSLSLSPKTNTTKFQFDLECC